MTRAALAQAYRDYIACLNNQDWANLGRFVHGEVRYNGRAFGLAGYQRMLERDFTEIPDLSFKVRVLVCDPPIVASRLDFDCAPRAAFLGLPVNGRRISFSENVFYVFREAKIHEVWSVIDKIAIEAQLSPYRQPDHA